MAAPLPSPQRAAPAEPGRWELVRDVLTFQVKLLLDGTRDLLLSPVSLIAALVDLLRSEGSRSAFYELVRLGRRSEAWIDLFAAADRVAPRAAQPEPDAPRLDDALGRLEQLLVREVERGGITASAKETIDRWLDRVQQRTSR